MADKVFSEIRPKGINSSLKLIISVKATELRDYFGEKIAIYFAFLAYYSKFLIPMALIGIPIFIVQYLASHGSGFYKYTNLVFSFVHIAWMIVLFEFWTRKEAYYSVLWGQMDFEETEEVRPAFDGVACRDPTTDDKELYFSKKKRCIRVSLAAFISTFIVVTVLLIIAGLLVLRKNLIDKWGDTSYAFLATTIPSILNAIQIIVFNAIYSSLAYHLTNYENHKTQTSYE